MPDITGRTTRIVKPSTWGWSGGAGWPSEEVNKSSPWAFRTRADLLRYFEIMSLDSWYVYSLNGVSTSLAISAVNACEPALLLYVSSYHASQYQHYLVNNFGLSVPSNAGPALSATLAQTVGASYVAIFADPAAHPFVCHRVNSSKLTLIGSSRNLDGTIAGYIPSGWDIKMGQKV
jgi:hypothetical protein